MRISDLSSDVCSSDLPTIAITDALVGGPSVDRENPFSYDVYNNFLSANRIRNYGGSAQMDYDLGNMALTAITDDSEGRTFDKQDTDGTAADMTGRKSDEDEINTFTQEGRLETECDGTDKRAEGERDERKEQKRKKK